MDGLALSRRRLSKYHKRYDVLERELFMLRASLLDLVLEAQANGLTITEIAELSGHTRMHIYTVLTGNKKEKRR